MAPADMSILSCCCEESAEPDSDSSNLSPDEHEDKPKCSKSYRCGGWVFVFILFVVVVAITIPLSPGFGSAEGFDIITLSSAAVHAHDWMKQNPGNLRVITGMIVFPFYALMAAFVIICVKRDDVWLFLAAIIGWVWSLLICLCIGIPVASDRLRYWESGFFPLEYVLSDNTVNMHLVISFICSSSILEVTGKDLTTKVYLFFYNFILVLFTIITHSSSPQAALIGLSVAMLTMYFNQVFKLHWADAWRNLQMGFGIEICGCICCRRVAHSKEERARLAPSAMNSKFTIEECELDRFDMEINLSHFDQPAQAQLNFITLPLAQRQKREEEDEKEEEEEDAKLHSNGICNEARQQSDEYQE